MRWPMIRTVLCFMATLGVWLNPAAAFAAAPMSEADIQVERLLWAVGSRPAWANLTNTVVYTQQHRRDDPTDVGAVVVIDYRQPRLRIDTTGRDLQLVRVIDSDGDRNWRLDRQGRSEKVPEDTLAQDLRRYTAHIYWTLQRILSAIPSFESISLATAAWKFTKGRFESRGTGWMHAASPMPWAPMTTTSGSFAGRGMFSSAASVTQRGCRVRMAAGGPR